MEDGEVSIMMKCQNHMKKADVSVEVSRKKEISYQCDKCGVSNS